MAPGTYILHASKSSSIELSDKFHVNPVETSSKIDEKPQFDRILVRYEVKMDPKYYPWGAHILHIFKRSYRELQTIFQVNLG